MIPKVNGFSYGNGRPLGLIRAVKGIGSSLSSGLLWVDGADSTILADCGPMVLSRVERHSQA